MKVFLDMVGCRLNQSELENYARQFRMAGHSLVSKPELADMIVLNTCTVTAAAASDSRQKIRQAGRSGASQVIVTGCWSSLHEAEAASFPGVTRLIGNMEKDDLVPTVLDLPAVDFASRSIKREPIPGARQRSRAFIKVQDGCDNHCTYCITTLARGVGRSRKIPEILADVRSAQQGGAKEIVLTGVHLGSWGYDFEPHSSLLELVKALLSETEIPRIHLSSIEPWDISPGFFQLWRDPRLCRHLHLPLQSGSRATLKRMGRKITPQAYANIVQHARGAIPGVAITTDIIVGFPGETEKEFLESTAFIEEMAFTQAHIFTYSAMPGTAAARLPDQIPMTMAKQRNALLRQVAQKSSSQFLEAQLGQELLVLWEKVTPIKVAQWQLSGLTDNYLRIRAISPTPCANQIMPVRVTGISQGELTGEVTQA
jgi:threonylcarbamoyladenosine tRNA methylthiotransferase MtaB